MYRVEQVLVPVDFSSFSRCAVKFARTLSGDREDEAPVRLQLGHAVESIPPYVRSVLFPYAALGEDDRRFEAEIAGVVRDEIEQYFELDDALRERFIAEPVVEFGSSRRRVVDWARRFDADLIVAGAFGRHGVFAAGPGSTARRLAATASCPVVLVRDYEPTPQVDRIVAAVDFGQDAARVVQVAISMALDQNARVELVHVIPSPFVDDTNWQVERHVELTHEQVESTLRPRAERRFEELLEQLQLPFRHREVLEKRLVGTTVAFGEPVAQIGERASQIDADMVVVGEGGRDGEPAGSLGRVASAVITRVGRHLMVVPSRRDNTPLTRRDGR